MQKKQLIKTFEEIRDLPYRIPLTKTEIKTKDYSCVGKSKMLYQILKSDYPVRYRFSEFKWKKNANLPHDILKKFKGEDTDYHCYIEIYLNNKWITLDPSLDKKLGKLIPINYWDGKTNTSINFNYDRIIPPSTKESDKLEKEAFNADERILEIKKNYIFFKEFNQLFEKIRNL